MTIVVGLRCREGVVICADRQISVVDGYKFFETKITPVEFPFGPTVVLGYAGTRSLAIEARDKILERYPQSTEQDLYSTCDAVLTDMGRYFSEIGIRLLVGFVSPPKEPTPSLLGFDGKGLHRVEDYSFQGAGDSSLVHFLAQKLYSPSLSIRETADAAAYIVRKAEQYVDHCSGPIDTAVLRHDDFVCEMIAPEDTEARLLEMEKGESAFTDLLLRQPFSSSSSGP